MTTSTSAKPPEGARSPQPLLHQKAAFLSCPHGLMVSGQFCPPRTGCLLHHTLEINVWCSSFSLLHLLIRAWLMEAHFSLLLPTGHSDDPSVQSPLFLGLPSQLAAPPSLAAVVHGLSRSVGHDLQSMSSSQASALLQFSPWLRPLFLSAVHFLSLFHPGKVPVLL